MKKLLLLLVCAFSFYGVAQADNDKPIKVNELPKTAQAFLKQHFANAKVSYAMVEKSLFSNEYKVVFENANKIEFDKDGAWTDIECKVGGVPVAVVAPQIKAYVAKNHPNMKVSKMDKSTFGYEITLSNGMELQFDSKFKFVKYDD